MLKTVFAFLALVASPAVADETARPLPAPTLDATLAGAPSATAVLAGGCFWGIQGVFQHVKGVKQVLSGYSGGAAASARYPAVGTGTTGHAESVQIVFDPHVVSYGQILQVFFSVMDPTTLDYQGPDYGPQYRSEVFAADAAQRRTAEAYIAQLTKAHAFSDAIVTRVSTVRGFYPAEAYHQDYLVRHPDQPYIAVNDLPKIDKLHRFYSQLYREHPVTVAQR
jgi:peptide-methionine (S)-S-oxide reductase